MIRRRQREIPFEELLKIKKGLALGWEEIEMLLDVSASQRKRYAASRRLPATRYYAARDALLLHEEEQARKRRQQILELFK